MNRFFRLFPAARRALALGLVLGFAAVPLGIAHLGAGAPDACEAVARSGQGPATVEAGQWFGADHHCLTCHWLHDFRSSDLPLPAAVDRADDGPAIEPAHPDGPQGPTAAIRSARAPPALLHVNA
jgi:hypothetical protein